MYKDAESNPEREITKCPHDACSKLLILQRREPTWHQGQVGIRGLEGYLGKSDQPGHNNVLCDCDPHAPHASKVARAGMEWR